MGTRTETQARKALIPPPPIEQDTRGLRDKLKDAALLAFDTKKGQTISITADERLEFLDDIRIVVEDLRSFVSKQRHGSCPRHLRLMLESQNTIFVEIIPHT